MKKLLCQSISAGVTKAFGRKVAEHITYGGTLLLEGELGAGKTTFVQGLAEGLGITRRLTSPTFALMNVYPVRHAALSHLVHVDLYRLTSADNLTALDLDRWVSDPTALLVVEWPERTAAVWRNVVGTIRFTAGDTIALRQLAAEGDVVDLLQ